MGLHIQHPLCGERREGNQVPDELIWNAREPGRKNLLFLCLLCAFVGASDLSGEGRCLLPSPAACGRGPAHFRTRVSHREATATKKAHSRKGMGGGVVTSLEHPRHYQ